MYYGSNLVKKLQPLLTPTLWHRMRPATVRQTFSVFIIAFKQHTFLASAMCIHALNHGYNYSPRKCLMKSKPLNFLLWLHQILT